MPKEQAKTISKDNIIFGTFMGLAGFFLLAMMAAFTKLLATNHHVVEIAFYRNVIAALAMFAYIAASRRFDLLQVLNKPMMAARVIVGTITLYITYTAIKLLPIADATVLFMASTLIVPVLAILLLGEVMGWRRWSAVLVGFIGVILVAGPTGNLAPIGVIVALVAACGHASVYIILRFLKQENSFTVTFYFVLGGAVMSAIFMPFIAAPVMPHEIFWILGVAATGGLAQYCMTSGFKYAPASVISPLNYTGLLWATGLDILIWKHIPGWPVFIGGAVIVAANCYIVVRENRRRK